MFDPRCSTVCYKSVCVHYVLWIKCVIIKCVDGPLTECPFPKDSHLQEMSEFTLI